MSCMHKTFHCQKFPNCFIAVHVYSVIISDACCRGQHKQSLGDAFWDAWACVCSSGTHLKVDILSSHSRQLYILLFNGELVAEIVPSQDCAVIPLEIAFRCFLCMNMPEAQYAVYLQEKTQEGRTIGILLAFGGLLFYSLLTSTMTAQIKVWSFFPLSFTFCSHCPHNHAYISSAFFMEHIVQMIAAILKPT